MTLEGQCLGFNICKILNILCDFNMTVTILSVIMFSVLFHRYLNCKQSARYLKTNSTEH